MDTKLIETTIEYCKHIDMPCAEEAAEELAALRSRLSEVEEALELIGDLAFDRDGYTGNADKLGELIDELYSYAKDPKKAILVNHPDKKVQP